MSDSDDLARTLARISSDAVRRFEIPTADVLHDLSEINKRLSARSGTPPRGAADADLTRRIRSVFQCLQTDDDRDMVTADVRLACFEVVTLLKPEGYCLIGDTKPFQRLLGTVAGYGYEPRIFKRLYRGLLMAYLGLDRGASWAQSPTVCSNFEYLRQFLATSLEICQSGEVLPDWVEALLAHPAIFGEEPGKPFASALLAGDRDLFQRFCVRLGISNSWLADEVLLSAAHSAAGSDDRAFVAAVPLLLSHIAQHRFASLRDRILATLLDRYALISPPAVHVALRDFAVGAWKNPWLTRHEAAWGCVKPTTRQMVAGWLKLELIHQFFEVLAEDGRQDKSRFEFWRDYYKQMDDVYFALGSNAIRSNSPDMKKLRAALEGRLFELVGADPDNNAFVMVIGDLVVIEFSKSGNAAYRYHRSELPLDASRRSIGIGELKCDRSRRMLHKSSGGLSWQMRFTRALKDSHGISTATHGDRSRSASPSYIAPAPVARDTQSWRSAASSIVSEETIRAFATTRGLSTADFRSKGGSLWIYGDDQSPAISRQLESWGFRYRVGKGWWRTI